MKYVCDICGYVYDPEVGDPDNGVAPGTPWEEVPEDWVCPLWGCLTKRQPLLLHSVLFVSKRCADQMSQRLTHGILFKIK